MWGRIKDGHSNGPSETWVGLLKNMDNETSDKEGSGIATRHGLACRGLSRNGPSGLPARHAQRLAKRQQSQVGALCRPHQQIFGRGRV